MAHGVVGFSLVLWTPCSPCSSSVRRSVVPLWLRRARGSATPAALNDPTRQASPAARWRHRLPRGRRSDRASRRSAPTSLPRHRALMEVRLSFSFERAGLRGATSATGQGLSRWRLADVLGEKPIAISRSIVPPQKCPLAHRRNSLGARHLSAAKRYRSRRNSFPGKSSGTFARFLRASSGRCFLRCAWDEDPFFAGRNSSGSASTLRLVLKMSR